MFAVLTSAIFATAALLAIGVIAVMVRDGLVQFRALRLRLETRRFLSHDVHFTIRQFDVVRVPGAVLRPDFSRSARPEAATPAGLRAAA